MSKQRLNEVIITVDMLDGMYERYLMNTPLYDVDPPKNSSVIPTCCTITLVVLIAVSFVAFVWCGVTG